jgi:hypothetical protein
MHRKPASCELLLARVNIVAAHCVVPSPPNDVQTFLCQALLLRVLILIAISAPDW